MPDTAPQRDPDQRLALRIRRKTMLTADICLFELARDDGGALPPFTPGAHVTVETPSGARRNYSLANPPADGACYRLGVKAERGGRGGSLSLVERAREGDSLRVAPPRNDFPLHPADEYIFVAGGIGITPIMSMIGHLEAERHAAYRLIYCTRDAAATAFRDDLLALGGSGRVTIHHDGGDPERAFDFWPLFERPGKAHVYCCGPRPLMEDVRAMTGHWPAEAIHFEDFASDVRAVRPNDRAFTVRHAGSGETIAVAAGSTILEALRRAGHGLRSSCESGTCGSCKTVLVAGAADHRDMVLTDEEKAGHIMICVSRALSDELVLEW